MGGKHKKGLDKQKFHFTLYKLTTSGLSHTTILPFNPQTTNFGLFKQEEFIISAREGALYHLEESTFKKIPKVKRRDYETNTSH